MLISIIYDFKYCIAINCFTYIYIFLLNYTMWCTPTHSHSFFSIMNYLVQNRIHKRDLISSISNDNSSWILYHLYGHLKLQVKGTPKTQNITSLFHFGIMRFNESKWIYRKTLLFSYHNFLFVYRQQQNALIVGGGGGSSSSREV
jgi:hypothetical protein